MTQLALALALIRLLHITPREGVPGGVITDCAYPEFYHPADGHRIRGVHVIWSAVPAGGVRVGLFSEGGYSDSEKIKCPLALHGA